MFLQSRKKLLSGSKKLNFNCNRAKKQDKLKTSVYSIENQTMPRYMFARENENTHLPIQRYVKSNGYTLSAPAEDGRESGHRCLMVKDGEPASLYINTIVNDTDLKNNLKMLGIEAKEDTTNCLEEIFVKYGQGKIPRIYQRPVNKITEEIPFRERSFRQKLKSFYSSAPTREIEIYGNSALSDKGQSNRLPDKKQKAETRLEIQYNILENVISITQWYLQKLESESLDVLGEEFRRNKERLEELLHRYQANEEGLLLVMMGTDTFRSIRLVYEIINGGLERLGEEIEADRLREDKKIALEMAIEDLQYRSEQIKSERAVSNLEPYIPTGCNASADERFRLLDFDKNRGDSVAALFEDKDMFPGLISWRWHYTTEIKQRLTKDALFIDDAVGKSLDDNEMMNAHWSAHIYGTEETAVDESRLVLLDGRNAVDVTGKVVQSQCRLNQMSDGFRSACFKNVNTNSRWKLKYQVRNKLTGILEVFVENKLIKYKLIPQNREDFTAAMQHFLLETADLVVEDFIITTIIGKMDTVEGQQYNEIVRRISANLKIPGTRANGSNYLIEEANIEE